MMNACIELPKSKTKRATQLAGPLKIRFSMIQISIIQ
jgi:hypothetical protein